MFFVIFVKLGVYITFIAVKHQYPVSTLLINLYILIKMLQLFETSFVISPAILGCFNNPIAQNIAVRVPSSKVKSACNAEERRYHMAICCRIVNGCSPFSIARLDSLWLANPIRACYHHSRPNHSHYKAGFIEVVKIAVLDTIFGSYISE